MFCFKVDIKRFVSTAHSAIYSCGSLKIFIVIVYSFMVLCKISFWFMHLQFITHINTLFKNDMEQKGVSSSGIKICNSLPSNIQSYRNDRKRFKNKFYRYLIMHSFYSITEFLECKIDKDNI